MTREVLELWARAQTALATATALLTTDPDASASRSYYAAFYAVCALFAAQGTTFAKHTAVEVAVHRDLVKPGRWSNDLGRDYSWLRGLRATGDYGVGAHVSSADARSATEAAARIVEAVRRECGELPG